MCWWWRRRTPSTCGTWAWHLALAVPGQFPRRGRLGPVLSNWRSHNLAQLLSPGRTGKSGAALAGSPGQVLALPAPVREGIVKAFARSIRVVFLAGVPVVAPGLLLGERPLDTAVRPRVPAAPEPARSVSAAPSPQEVGASPDERRQPVGSTRCGRGRPAARVSRRLPLASRYTWVAVTRTAGGRRAQARAGGFLLAWLLSAFPSDSSWNCPHS